MNKPERVAKPIQFAAFTLPHAQMRSYPDLGDWLVNADNSPALICAADTGDDRSNLAILLHEIVESFICFLTGVREEAVTEFDRKWFAEHPESDEEPGNDRSAPYHMAHLIATRYERDFCDQIGLMWSVHEENCDKVSP